MQRNVPLCMYVCTYVRTYVCMYVWTDVRMYVCVCAYTEMYTSCGIHKNKFPNIKCESVLTSLNKKRTKLEHTVHPIIIKVQIGNCLLSDPTLHPDTATISTIILMVKHITYKQHK